MPETLNAYPHVLSSLVQTSSVTAESSGHGRFFLDLGKGARLHLCDPRIPEAVDVIFESWGLIPPREKKTFGEQIANSPSARGFKRKASGPVMPILAFFSYGDSFKTAMAAALSLSEEKLFIWPEVLPLSNAAGTAAFRQTSALTKYLSQGWSPEAETPVENLATWLLAGTSPSPEKPRTRRPVRRPKPCV